MLGTHWVVIQYSHFTGNEAVVERRRKRGAAQIALNLRERYADADKFYFELLRSDEAESKGIK